MAHEVHRHGVVRRGGDGLDGFGHRSNVVEIVRPVEERRGRQLDEALRRLRRDGSLSIEAEGGRWEYGSRSQLTLVSEDTRCDAMDDQKYSETSVRSSSSRKL